MVFLKKGGIFLYMNLPLADKSKAAMAFEAGKDASQPKNYLFAPQTGLTWTLPPPYLAFFSYHAINPAFRGHVR